MQRKNLLYLVAVLALLISMFPAAAIAQEAPPAGQAPSIEEFAAPDDKTESRPDGSQAALFAPDGMSFFNETEPNDTAATANALPGSQVVVLGNISPATEVDFFSFTANQGDRVYAATMTSFSNGGSTDTILDIYASDGVTLLETDDDSGSFSSTSSAIGGTIIPAAGTYYIKVDGFSGTSTITPYHLHVRVQSGTPTPEVEPNNDLATATPLAASQWMSGTVTATTDPDFFSFTLNAGDSVFLGLDMDPGRIPSNTNWNGRLGFGIFAGNQILVVNDGSTTKPHAEAFFMTVQQAGTYYAYVDSTSATGLGPNARYHLSVSIYPKAAQQNCTTFTSTDVPQLIGPGVGTTNSTITVPGNVTSSITDVNATIVLTHTNMPDLDVTLVGPTAASTALFTDIGSSTQVPMNVGLDDQAALPIGTYTVVSGMVNQPEQPGRLATFNGTPAAGTWTLQLADDTTNTSGGRLQSWSLEICGAPPPDYAIELNKTVGTQPAVCATTDSVTVPPGGFDVYYCYTVRNTGLNTLNVHDLVDSELGTLFTGVNYALTSGATYSYIEQATVYDTVTNTGTWTAYNVTDGNPTVTASDTATVNVRQLMCPAGYQPVTVDATFFDNPFPPAGWTVTNTSTGCVAPGLPDWTNTNPGNRANLTGGVGPFAIADSDRCGSGSTLDTIMTTGLLDFTGLISPTVSFNTDYDDLSVGGVNDQAILDVSTDGGANWSNLFTWDSDHRGPLLVDQALPGAGENDVQVRWHYATGTWDWWWQVDNAFLTACAPLVSSISLDKTVGTDPNTCSMTDEITLPYGGGNVTYCFEVTNTGDVSFNTHDLNDSELGNVFTGLSYLLTPGASVFVTETTFIDVTTVNTGVWTAYNTTEGGPPPAEASDVATVTVDLPDPALVLTKTVGLDVNACATTDEITVAPNTDVTYCYEVENSGNVPFNLHNLDDSELGNIFTGLFYQLDPGASVFVTETANIAVTTVNTATWSAELAPQEGNFAASATDVATVTVESQNPAIVLTKTVGMTPGVCAVTDEITVPAGTEVYYCYQVENTGDVAFNFHDLEDSELGVILDNFPYTLSPGAFSPQVIVPETINITTTNCATWTAFTSLSGYVYDDGAPFDYSSIATFGTPLGLADDGEANVTMPFPFTYFGVTSSDLRVGNNGGILFNATAGDVGITNAALPNAAHPLAIFPFWDDIDSDTGNVYYATVGTAPNRQFIVEWFDRPHFSNVGSATFQVVLYEGTNQIKFLYADVNFGNASYDFGASATVGLNKDGTTALQYSFNQPVITDQMAILWTPVEALSASDSACAMVNVQYPQIDVDPLNFDVKVGLGQATTRTLTIANVGDAPLDWVIDEEDTTAAATTPTVPNANPAAALDVVQPGDGTKLADSAPAPLSTWRTPEAVLWDNGPLVTNPGGGAGGADASALQTALGLSTYGFGHAVSSGFRVADDFTVPAGGWLVSDITFFAYQTGSTTTSTINNVNLRIWDGPPGQGGSNVVFGDTATNRLASSAWSNIYRVLDTGLLDTARPVMADVATVNTFLPAGTYWLDWQTGGTLASGPWAPPVSIVGQTAKPGANGLQYDPTAGTWNPLLDTGAAAVQDLPFIIQGTPAAGADCLVPSDISWLTVTPDNGTTAAGGSTPVQLDFDSTGLLAGIYTGNLCITSNDPDAGPGNGTDLVIVPITLEVNPPTAVALTDLAAGTDQMPAPAGVPLGAAAAAGLSMAMAAGYALRRRRQE